MVGVDDLPAYAAQDFARRHPVRRSSREPHRNPTSVVLVMGLVIETVYYVKFRTRAEAQRRCDQLKAEDLIPADEYMPLSRWRFDAQSKTCGIRR